MSDHNVLILILIYNALPDTIECLESLAKLSFKNYQILVVDNGSRDDSVAYIKSHYSEVKLIENHANLGYAAGNNVGISYFLKHDYTHLLIINNDITVDAQLLEVLLGQMEKEPTVGIIGPVNYSFADQQKVVNNYATLDNQKYQYNIITDGPLADELVETEYVNGAAMLIKREALEKTGGFRPEYFLYWEETDLCFRARQADYKCVTSQKTFIHHKVGASLNQKYSTVKTYYYYRNRLYFFKVNQMFSGMIYLYLGYDFMILFLSCLKHQPAYLLRITNAFIKAVKDFQANKMGKGNILN
jgi:GT2 family glycosyltransferase